MKQRFGLIFSCLTVILVLLPLSLFADFDDVTESPKPTPSSTAISTPVSPSNSGNVIVTPKEPVQQKTKEAPDSGRKSKGGQGSNTVRSSKSGDILSGNLFGSVEHDTTAPVSWKSDSAYGSRDKGVFVLTGHVTVVQDDLTFTSESMDIIASPITKKPEKIIGKNKAVARKEVNKKIGDYIEARAQQMNYDLATGLFTLTTNARVTRGKDCDIKGDILYYDMRSGSISGKQISGSCVPPAGQ